MNDLTGEIPSTISNLSNLEILQLGDNSFTGKVPYLGAMSKLNTLLLDGNQLSGDIPEEICNLISLKTVSFFNKISITLIF